MRAGPPGAQGWGKDRKRAVLSLTFDNLGEAADLEFGTWPAHMPVGSHYTIVDVVPQLLQRLDGISVTFFAEGWNADTYPDTLRAIADHDHEVGLHGWRHEIWSKLDASTERTLFEKSVTAMRRIGLDPKGFRPPGGAATEQLPALLRAQGMTYMSAVGEGDSVAGGIARTPFAWKGVDGVYLQPELGKAVGLATGELSNGATGADAVAAEFSRAIANALETGSHTVLVFHPWLLGQDPKRMDALEAVMDAAKAERDLWIAPCREVAGWLLQEHA